MNIGFAGILTIVFVVLKAMGYIGWSWWWVLAPIWISVILTVAFLTVYAGLVAFVASRVTT